MATEQQTPVGVVQELIALHTTRKEASEKLAQTGAVADGAAAAGKQSDAAIAALMAELAQFGDAVGAAVDRDNPYQTLYRQSLDDLKSRDTAASAFQRLEEALKVSYKAILDVQTDLPQPLLDLIQKQYTELG